MDADKRKNTMIANAMRRDRMMDKALENCSKPPLSSSDVVQTSDYIFSPIKPLDRVGDSGPLLLAKLRAGRSQRYLVKHAYTDCAANEFVYTKLAQAMGTKMPDAVLFQISEGEKRRCFKTEYIIGLKYLDMAVENPSYQQIREQALNWQDYFRFRAMYDMFQEGDTFETPLASDRLIYRVDTTDAFPLCDHLLSGAGLNIEMESGINVKETVRQYTMHLQYDRLWENRDFDYTLHRLVELHGEEGIPYFLEPFALIQEVKNDYIDDFLNTLCYFYPDFIGDYFKLFITTLQKESYKYLKSKNCSI